MKFSLRLFSFLFTVVLAVAQAVKPVTADNLIEMKKAGFDDQTIIKAIEANGASIDTSVQGLITLKNAGLSDGVIKAALATASSKAAPLVPTKVGDNVLEPEYVGVVFYIDRAAGALSPLEKQKSNVAAKVKAFGFGGMDNSVVFEGPKSPIRFKVGQDVQFVVRGMTAGVEPDSVINLDVLTVSKQQRAIVTMKTRLFSGAKGQAGKTLRQLTFGPYGEHSLKFSPAQNLEPGEYVITTREGPNAFLFGIDPQ